MKLGFIGLGRMGAPMTRHLLKAGYSVTIHNRSRGVVDQLVPEGARAARSPAEVAAETDVVLTCLTNTPAVEGVYFGENGLVGAARAGQIFIDHGTVSPTTSHRCADQFRARGADFLDAPVSGGPAGAEAATLTIMVGGEASTFEKVKPIFEVFGKNIRHVGPTGAGSAIKLANQLMVAVNVAGVVEAMVLGVKAGADPQVMFDVLSTSFGGSAMLSRCVPMMLKRNFTPGTSVDLLLKDIGLITDLGGDLNVRTLLLSTASQVFREGRAIGLGIDDMAGLVRALEQQAGVVVAPSE